jgi:gamma-glutamyltranspeptidase/glutathione hydrolase
MVAKGLARRGVALGMSLVLTGCGTVGAVKRTIVGPDPNAGPPILSGFIGGIAADEPRAVLAAKQVLATGGTAADAAVVLGFMLSVTLPSRASLGSGGACIAYRPGGDGPNKGVPEAILFTPVAPAASTGDRPAAVPMLARGLYLLSARYGSQDFGSLVAPAQLAAGSGFAVSRALANDIAEVAGPLIADPSAAAVFAPGGTALAEHGNLVQTALAGTLGQLRSVGVGDMYQGLLAHKLVEATAQAGGGMGLEDLRQARATLAQPLVVQAGRNQVALLPEPTDGGLAASAALAVLQHDANDDQDAGNAAIGAAARARGTTALPNLPASTSFVVVDRKGGAVACALTMDNLFGTGRIAPGTGILLAASPRAKPLPLLEAGIGWNANADEIRAAVGASGQASAALAEAAGLSRALGGAAPGEVPDPGRTNAAYCTGGAESCRFATDPRGAGLATGG